MLFWTISGNHTQIISSCTAIYFPSHKPSKWDEQDMRDIAGKCKGELNVRFTYGSLLMDKSVLTNQEKNYIYQFCVDTACRQEWIARESHERDLMMIMMTMIL